MIVDSPGKTPGPIPPHLKSGLHSEIADFASLFLENFPLVSQNLPLDPAQKAKEPPADQGELRELLSLLRAENEALKLKIRGSEALDSLGSRSVDAESVSPMARPASPLVLEVIEAETRLQKAFDCRKSAKKAEVFESAKAALAEDIRAAVARAQAAIDREAEAELERDFVLEKGDF